MLGGNQVAFKNNSESHQRTLITNESLDARAIKHLQQANVVANKALLGEPARFPNGQIPDLLTEKEVTAMFTRIDRRSSAIERLGGRT